MDIIKVKETGDYIFRFSSQEMMAVTPDTMKLFGEVIEQMKEEIRTYGVEKEEENVDSEG